MLLAIRAWLHIVSIQGLLSSGNTICREREREREREGERERERYGGRDGGREEGMDV